MMRSLCFLSAALFLISGSAFAEKTAPVWEVSGGPGLKATYLFVQNSPNYIRVRLDDAITGEIGYRFSPHLQAVISPAFSYDSNGPLPNTTTFKASIGLNYSFLPEIRDSYFVEGKLGMKFTNDPNAVATTYVLDAGKRISLNNRICDGYLSLIPIQFSLFF